MAKKGFHNQHSKGTKTKLEIFDKYFNESLPVFIHSAIWQKIFIYDLFAGKGKDDSGEFGTSLNVIKGISSHCFAINQKQKKLYVILNDKEESEVLSKNVEEYLIECRKSCELKKCILQKNENLVIKNENFEAYFNTTIYPRLSKVTNSAKIIFLDPFNFVMNDLLFNKLTSLKSTDFICFMPSAYLKRFKNTTAFNTFIDKDKISFDETHPNECHRIIAHYFETLVSNKEYYIGYFSIRYEKNVYGVIFGSSHTFGAEKFQKVCWTIDKTAGEADYNIDREVVYDGQHSLFEEDNICRKLKNFNETLENAIKNKVVNTDLEAYKFALKQRCLPKHAADVLKKLMKEKKVNNFKTKGSDIHKINTPVKITYNETN